MTNIVLCVTQSHDPRLVVLALLICLIGSFTTVQLFGRIRSTVGMSRTGWIVLAAVATGTMVWSTHFVAMMAFRTAAAVALDPILTLASLLVAIACCMPGLAMAAKPNRSARVAGGAIVGASIAAMHYLGMAAFHIAGVVTWAFAYVTGSVFASMILSASAFVLMGVGRPRRVPIAAGLLSLAVATLHFTGMAALHISTTMPGHGLSPLTMTALAVTTAVAALIVIGCAAVSALIDGHTQGEAYSRLRRVALHDVLTDLPNRMSFNEEFARRLSLRGGYACMAVVMLDLSRFKAVNDAHGHQAGDQLLIALAERWSALLQPGECMCRLGGDEFAALVSYDGAGALTDFLARVSSVFDKPFVFERFTASLGVNIGVALAVQDGSDADTLLAKADLAMYRAKSAHSDVPCFYDAAMDDAVRSRRELANDLRGAIRDGAFELHYQVQAAIATGEVTGYEALVRWQHPDHGLVSPGVFIPLAEESGEIIALSVWIIRQACVEAASWPVPYDVAVNLSPRHLADPQLVDVVRFALSESGLPADRLSLELTESAIIHDRRFALEQLRALKALGISIALDDFGVGYSSLDVLRSFAFDRIKLDASFVAEIERDEQAVSILRSVSALGTTLRMPVLAEGIERSAQLAIVAREGCASIQGYLIGRPSRQLMDPLAVQNSMMLKPRSLDAPLAAAAAS